MQTSAWKTTQRHLVHNNPPEATSTIPNARISINTHSSFRMTCLVIHQVSKWAGSSLTQYSYLEDQIIRDSQTSLAEPEVMLKEWLTDVSEPEQGHVSDCSFRSFPLSCGDTPNLSLTVSTLTAHHTEMLSLLWEVDSKSERRMLRGGSGGELLLFMFGWSWSRIRFMWGSCWGLDGQTSAGIPVLLLRLHRRQPGCVSVHSTVARVSNVHFLFFFHLTWL